MHVCAIARARATIGGPLRNDRLKRTSARAAAFQSLTTVACAEVAHRRAGRSVARAILCEEIFGRPIVHRRSSRREQDECNEGSLFTPYPLSTETRLTCAW